MNCLVEVFQCTGAFVCFDGLKKRRASRLDGFGVSMGLLVLDVSVDLVAVGISVEWVLNGLCGCGFYSGL